MSDENQNSFNYMNLINNKNENKIQNKPKSHAEAIKNETKQQFQQNQSETCLNQQYNSWNKLANSESND